MAQLHVLMGADTIRARPTVRRIGLADLKDALARGFATTDALALTDVLGRQLAMAAVIANRHAHAAAPAQHQALQ